MAQQQEHQRQLEGKVALVTGGGNGIGAGICRVLAERGAKVAVSDISLERAQSISDEIASAGGTAIPLSIDVTDVASLNAGVSRVLEEFGQLDICVPNAGVVGTRGFETRSDFVDGDWDATNSVNVRGLVNTAEAVLPHMRERKYGKIINIASQGGRAPRGPDVVLGRQTIPYLVSKAAAIQWTHLLAQDVGKHSINVNCVCPGTVWSDIWESIGVNRSNFEPNLGADARAVFDAATMMRHPLQLEQTPEDIGHSVAFLASDEASEITGQALNVNAGSVLS
ncbi:MAG: SDR family oxidoreductase [Chloroflexi bacterium]|nr:SDR family oxidoreductase [Chloroflexota bacterium]